MADQLDTMFRELADAPEPVGLRSATDVRRRGDHRRRSQRAGAVVAVAILAVGTVGVVEATRTRADRGNQTIPADTPTSLAAAPLLRAGDIPAIGPYTSFQAAGSVDADDPFRLQDSVNGLTAPSAWFGVQQIERQRLASDLEADLIETVLLFGDENSAAVAAAWFPTSCDAFDQSQLGATTTLTPLTPGVRQSQFRRLPDLHGSQRGCVSIPPGDGDIGYSELAVARAGRVVIVLDWASMGLPHGEDAESTQTWQWAIPEDLIATALDRATG